MVDSLAVGVAVVAHPEASVDSVEVAAVAVDEVRQNIYTFIFKFMLVLQFSILFLVPHGGFVFAFTGGSGGYNQGGYGQGGYGAPAAPGGYAGNAGGYDYSSYYNQPAAAPAAYGQPAYGDAYSAPYSGGWCYNFPEPFNLFFLGSMAHWMPLMSIIQV